MKNAALLQSVITKQMTDLYLSYTFEEFKEFFEKMSNPEFGKTGIVSYFCKGCGGLWLFDSRKDRDMFRRFHNATGCVYEYEIYNKEKNSKKYIKKHDTAKKIQGVVKKRNFSKDATSELAKKFIDGIVNNRILNDHESKSNTETVVSDES